MRRRITVLLQIIQITVTHNKAPPQADPELACDRSDKWAELSHPPLTPDHWANRNYGGFSFGSTKARVKTKKPYLLHLISPFL